MWSWILKEQRWLIALATAVVAFLEASGHPVSPTIMTLLVSGGIIYSRGPQTANLQQQTDELKAHVAEELRKLIQAK